MNVTLDNFSSGWDTLPVLREGVRDGQYCGEPARSRSQAFRIARHSPNVRVASDSTREAVPLVVGAPRHYSLRKTVAGCTREARHAGSRHAVVATPNRRPI